MICNEDNPVFISNFKKILLSYFQLSVITKDPLLEHIINKIYRSPQK
jgi:hypothetical protein